MKIKLYTPFIEMSCIYLCVCINKNIMIEIMYKMYKNNMKRLANNNCK